MHYLISIFLWLFAVVCALAQTYIPGNSYYGNTGYIQYIAGNIPVIISAPHGGYLEPADIPDHSCSGCVLVKDAYTLELANELAAAITAQTGCYPHIIINLLHRKKLDANRDIEEAADGNAVAEQAWYEFQGFIDSAKQQTAAGFGKGLYIDLHGHGHTIQRIELGYLHTAAELQLPDSVLNTNTYINGSSIKNLVISNLTNQTHAQLLRGNFALGTLLQNKGYPSVPSAGIPYPLPGEPYFNGGYNTARHSSYNGGTIDGIQMECNSGIRLTTAARLAFADSLATALNQYLEQHYFPFYSAGPCTVINLPQCAQQPQIWGQANTCAGTTDIYWVTPTEGATYFWTVTGGNIVNGQGTAQVEILWNNNVTGSVSVLKTEQ